MKNIFIILNIIVLQLFSVQLTNAQCIYPETGNSCISSETGEYVFRIDLQEDIKGYAEIHWKVKGGIEIVSSTQETVTIKSKTTDENQKYSKGRIYCYAYFKDNFTKERCVVYAPILLSQYDVYKSFDLNESTNKILGLSNISMGDTCLYSIKPLFTDADNIGMDNYYWNFSSGFSNDVLYTSADGSAISLKVNSLNGNNTIKVTAGQCNTNNPDNQLTLVLNKTPISQNTCSAEIIPYNVPVYGANVFYTLTELANVSIKIYDKNDNYIRTIFSAYMGQGKQAAYFQPTDLISGETYKCVIEIGEEKCLTDFVVE